MRFFESAHSYNKRHLAHVDKWIALVTQCRDDCGDSDKDLVPVYQQSLDLWQKAREMIDHGQGDLTDGIKQIAMDLHDRALWTSVRRLQKRLRGS